MRYFLTLFLTSVVSFFVAWLIACCIAEYRTTPFGSFPYDFSHNGLSFISVGLLIYLLNCLPVLFNIIGRVRRNRYLSELSLLLPGLLPLYLSFNSFIAISNIGLDPFYVFHPVFSLIFVAVVVRLYSKRKRLSVSDNHSEVLDRMS